MHQITDCLLAISAAQIGAIVETIIAGPHIGSNIKYEDSSE
jgi:hypothetical protein